MTFPVFYDGDARMPEKLTVNFLPAFNHLLSPFYHVTQTKYYAAILYHSAILKLVEFCDCDDSDCESFHTEDKDFRYYYELYFIQHETVDVPDDNLRAIMGVSYPNLQMFCRKLLLEFPDLAYHVDALCYKVAIVFDQPFEPKFEEFHELMQKVRQDQLKLIPKGVG